MQIGSDLKKRLHGCLIGCTHVAALICVHVRVVCVVNARCARTVCVCKFILPAHTMSEYFYIIFWDRYYESIIIYIYIYIYIYIRIDA